MGVLKDGEEVLVLSDVDRPTSTACLGGEGVVGEPKALLKKFLVCGDIGEVVLLGSFVAPYHNSIEKRLSAFY